MITALHDVVHNLEQAIGPAQVKFDQMTRMLYSTDASVYQITPIGVTVPRHADDVVAIYEIAAKYKLPLLPRGGGSGLAGQTVGDALVMDLSTYLRRVRSIQAEEHSVVVETGIVLDQLNRQMQPLGLMFGPDPASSNRATIGGCIGNNSTGSHSILYGMSADHIKRLEVVLASGEKVWLDAQTSSLQQIRQLVGELVTQHADEIQARYPKTFRTVAGYALNKIDPDDVNLNWLLVGSEGTLGTVTAAELNLVEYYPPAKRRLAIVHFNSLRESLEVTPRILELEPAAIELLDAFMLDKTRVHPEYSRYVDFVEGYPAVVLIVEFYGDSSAELDSHITRLKALLTRIGHTGAVTLAATPEQQARVWHVRKAGLGLIMSERGEAKPIPFVEDAAVPVEHLADYISVVEEVVKREGTTFAVYAHASAGCLHVRPLINLKTLRGREQFRSIADSLTEAALGYQGTITGEHGQGIVRGEYTERCFGPALTEAFRQIKRAFDPDQRMNPGKVVDTPLMDDQTLFRFKAGYEIMPLKTRFDWSADGGFGGAIEMCNGAAVCRKENVETMCPSFMATLDEQHATRGRANALRLALSGQVPGGVSNERLEEVFSLCLSCKACKAECPSAVDVARMKAEYLAARHDEKGTPISTRLFGNIHRINQLGSRAPRLANFLFTDPLGLAGAVLLGMPIDRPLPLLAMQRFSKRYPRKWDSEAQATLIIDTFTEFNDPKIGAALLHIAEKAGLKLNLLRLPEQGCCGRPAISKGLLDQGKAMANANVRFLSERVPTGPLLFLEPSCQSALFDDYPGLVDADLRHAAQSLAKRVMSAESWLVGQLRDLDLHWDYAEREILLHGHCHQKALWSTRDTLALLRLIPNAQVSEINSGCCGVAGSFGYEHYDISMKIANDRLLPAIKAAPEALIAAPGTSCRTQVSDAGHTVWHPLELVAQALPG